ncbi:hypothetical protein J5N97_001115 [Dioscorea zingiberensis]|uniref:Cationic amino acid transporter C-terminal domain-containing protein n=1 Tax=Dioscorea zingiberensis TaxID=325984 RepID=A0A9D5BVS3_9LILI|nr:hypothetical protein J5N97_001115 [Dioscorea zingiberensis]
MAGHGSKTSFFSGFCSSALRRKSLPEAGDPLISLYGEGLVRRLGAFELVLLGIGASIGAGIFVVTGTVARDAGPGVTISFILAGAACVLNALCYAELSSRFPAVVGGAYLYSYTAFNELTAFLVFLFPFLKGHLPSWIGHGEEFFGGVLSINILAPILLIGLTAILCCGVRESSAVNTFMTATKVLIVIFVIIAGAFEVDVSNWSPFAPNGFKAVVTGATVVFLHMLDLMLLLIQLRNPKDHRDLPIGILVSLLICAILYICVCLVITGMVPYQLLGEDAPLAEAFTAKGLKFVSVLISIGAVAGLTTTLLVGLYVQSRLYLGLGRDGLLPLIFAKVHPTRHTPIHSQVWVGLVAAIMSGLFNVHMLSHILSVGSLTGYSVVSACVITLRWKDQKASLDSTRCISKWHEGVICLLLVACGGFAAGLCYRFSTSYIALLVAIPIAVLAVAALQVRHSYADPPGFSCPGVPILPAVSIFFNIFLFAQLHEEAWSRFIILSIIAVGVYAFYGQFHANPTGSESRDYSDVYHRTPSEEFLS